MNTFLHGFNKNFDKMKYNIIQYNVGTICPKVPRHLFYLF